MVLAGSGPDFLEQNTDKSVSAIDSERSSVNALTTVLSSQILTLVGCGAIG